MKMLLRPESSDYLAVLRRCSDDGHLLTVTAQGNLNVLDSTLLGFFCSVRSPGDTILKTYDLARTLRDTDATIIGGFQSPMERSVMIVLDTSGSRLKSCRDDTQDGTGACPVMILYRNRPLQNHSVSDHSLSQIFS